MAIRPFGDQVGAAIVVHILQQQRVDAGEPRDARGRRGIRCDAIRRTQKDVRRKACLPVDDQLRIPIAIQVNDRHGPRAIRQLNPRMRGKAVGETETHSGRSLARMERKECVVVRVLGDQVQPAALRQTPSF